MRRAWTSAAATFAAAACAASLWSGSALAQAKTEVTFARFFGACDADYGQSQDVEKARGECGVMTTLVNRFNATNTDGIVVKPQIIEWGPYYQQLTARIAARDIPTIAVMHTAQIGDFIRSRIVEPIDDDLKAAGIDTNDFTPHAKRGVTLDGKIYALPWDTHSWLWHLNAGLFKEAGLVDGNAAPVMPKTVDELFAQAKTIKEKTGKPYFVMATTGPGDVANSARSFYTFLYTQGASLFPKGPDKADFSTPEATNAFDIFDRLSKEGYITKGIDAAGGLGGFINGAGAVYLTGTWRVDDMIAAAQKGTNPLKSYTARIFPNIYRDDAVWADNHSWVLMRGGSTDPKVRKAAQTFLKYLYDNNFQWARGGGHLPMRTSLLAEYAKLPERNNIIRITEIGRSMPNEVRRQFGFQALIGEEIVNVVNGGKPVAQALKDAQERGDQLLSRR